MASDSSQAQKEKVPEEGVKLPPFIDSDLFEQANSATEIVIRMFSNPQIPEHLRAKSIPEQVTRVHAAATQLIEALKRGVGENDESLVVYDGYYDDLQMLYLLGLQNAQMGNGGPKKIFEILMDLLTNCDTRATAEQRRARHLARFEQEPWRAAREKVKRQVMQELPGQEEVPEMMRAVDFVDVGDADAPNGESMKINLPSSAESFGTGNGEGTWGLVHPAIKARSDADEEANNHVFVGFLDNQPGYPRWRHLVVGDPVVFELRGTKRAIAFLDQDAVLSQDAAKLLEC
eukprot:m.365236 g.365236  ORF g.365236 m.365236 type:complete len:289 (-) comp16655_c0_seq2:3186-4052(-)